MVKKEIKKSPRKRKKPRFLWAGALKDLRDQYTSVELQHKISEWRIESALRYQKDLIPIEAGVDKKNEKDD